MSGGHPIEAVAGVVGNALLLGTLLTGVTALLAVTLLRRARPTLIAALWTVVLVKFLIPVGPASPISLNSLLDALHPAAARPELAAAAPGTMLAVAPAAAAPAAHSLWPALLLALLLVHVAGVLLLASRRVANARALGRAIRALPPAPAPVLELAARCAGELGLRRAPAVRIGAGAAPFVAGLLRPVVALPAWLCERPRELTAVLIHELAHVRRRDAYVRVLQAVVGTLFWFWPVVRWASRCLDQARELACDQWALRLGPLSAQGYARCLVGVVRHARGDLPAGALALAPRPSHLERRIDALLTSAPRPRLGLLLGAGVAGWGLICLGGAASAGAPHPTNVERICVLDPAIAQRILATNPEADSDGDGALSDAEVCAHQARMRRKLVEGLAETLSLDEVKAVYPDADADGDGALSAGERKALEQRMVVAVDPAVDDLLVVRLGGDSLTSTLAQDELGGLELDVAPSCMAECTKCECAAAAEARPEPAADRGAGVVLINVDFPEPDAPAPR